MTFYGRPAEVPYWRLSGFYFLIFVTVGIFLPYWALYLKSIGMNAEQIGILSAVVVFSKIFITYFWGWIVDHTGHRMRVIRFASLFSAICFSAALFFQGFWELFLVLFLFSIFWSASLPQIEAATLAHLGEATHSYTSIRIWGSVGFIIAVWILGAVFEIISIQHVPAAVLISLVVVWLVSLSIPEQNRNGEHLHHESLRSILSRPHVLALFTACFLMLASHGPYYTFFSIYLEDNGYTSSFIGRMWALGVIAEVLLFMVMRNLLQYFSLRILFLVSLLFAVIRWLLIGLFVDNVALLVIAQLFHAATFGMYHATAIQYIHRYFRGRLQGRGQALYSSSSFGAGMATGSLVCGYAWDKFGAMACFSGAAVTALVALLIAAVWLDN